MGRLIHQLLTDIGRYHPQVSVLTSQLHQAEEKSITDQLLLLPGFDLPADRGLQVHHHGPPQRCQQDPEEHV